MDLLKEIKMNQDDLDNLITEIKRHYENICKLCACLGVSHIPSICHGKREGNQLVMHARMLEKSLEHIKKKMRQMELAQPSLDPEDYMSPDRELCESLSNYRHDLEFLFRQVKDMRISCT